MEVTTTVHRLGLLWLGPFILHQLGLPLLVVFLFFDPVTLLLKSSLASHSFPWPALHISFALQFSESFQSYLQSQFYVSGSMKCPFLSYFRSLPYKISETLLPKVEVPSGKTLTRLHKNRASRIYRVLLRASPRVITKNILDNP